MSHRIPIVIRAGRRALGRIRAIGEGERLAEAFARWIERPDPAQVRPLG